MKTITINIPGYSFSLIIKISFYKPLKVKVHQLNFSFLFC